MNGDEARNYGKSEDSESEPRYSFYERGGEESRVDYDYELGVHEYQ